MSSAEAGSVWISLALRRSARRLAGRDRLSFARLGGAAAFGAVFAALGVACSLRPPAAFAGDALRTGGGPSRCGCGSAELAAELPAAALIGWDFAGAARLRGLVLAMDKRFLSIPDVRPGPVLVIIGHYQTATPSGHSDRKMFCAIRAESAGPRRSRITLAGLLALAALLASGSASLCPAAGQHLETGVQGLWVRHRRRAASRFRQQDPAVRRSRLSSRVPAAARAGATGFERRTNSRRSRATSTGSRSSTMRFDKPFRRPPKHWPRNRRRKRRKRSRVRTPPPPSNSNIPFAALRLPMVQSRIGGSADEA